MTLFEARIHDYLLGIFRIIEGFEKIIVVVVFLLELVKRYKYIEDENMVVLGAIQVRMGFGIQ